MALPSCIFHFLIAQRVALYTHWIVISDLLGRRIARNSDLLDKFDRPSLKGSLNLRPSKEATHVEVFALVLVGLVECFLADELNRVKWRWRLLRPVVSRLSAWACLIGITFKDGEAKNHYVKGMGYHQDVRDSPCSNAV